jgi:hypothetical protein
MANPKKYFHDHLVLVLLSIMVFLAIGSSLALLVRLSSGHGSAYIVQCRDCSNSQAIGKFTNGSVIDLIGFIFFSLLVLVTNTMLSLSAYKIHRQLAIAILSLGILLLVMTIIISNALLVLR